MLLGFLLLFELFALVRMLLFLTDHVHLPLPIISSLVIDLLSIDAAEADVHHLHDIIGYPFDLSLELEVRLPILSQVLLDDAKVVVDARLAHVDPLEHKRSCQHALSSPAGPPTRIHALVVLVGEETVQEVFIHRLGDLRSLVNG